MQAIALSLLVGGVSGICTGISSAKIAVRFLARRTELEADDIHVEVAPNRVWFGASEEWTSPSGLPSRHELRERKIRVLSNMAGRRMREWQ